jgi:hypothetical protein
LPALSSLLKALSSWWWKWRQFEMSNSNSILAWLITKNFTILIKKTKLRGLSPRAKYTDQAKLKPTSADRGVSCGQRDRFPRPYSRLSIPEPLLFLPSSSSVVLTRLSGPHWKMEHTFYISHVHVFLSF